jgi:tryptophan synthase alpha chain
MTASVSHRFESLKLTKNSLNSCGLIPFIMAGDPDLETTARALKVLDRCGASAIELGIPYSDPLADGPVIQAAATRALQRGITFDSILAMVAAVTPQLNAPLILFTYYNPILSRGIERFLDQIAAAGVRGLIVPDLPLEESQLLLEAAAKVGIELTLLVAPTSSPDRIKKIATASSGFIYLVSVTGVTGMRTQVSEQVYPLMQQIRQVTDKPIGIGFGISDPKQVAQMKEWGANAIIVGSACVNALASGTPEEGLMALEDLCGAFQAALAD